jgi:hypothetical protein
MRRALTVEEAKALPPPTEEELQQHREAVAGLRAIAEEIRARLGRDLTEEEFWWALDRDRDEDDCRTTIAASDADKSAARPI